MDDRQFWIFTFGVGQKYEGRYVKIFGTFSEARNKMVDKYGLTWAFQYSEEEWNDWLARKPFYIPAEKLLEIIEDF